MLSRARERCTNCKRLIPFGFGRESDSRPAFYWRMDSAYESLLGASQCSLQIQLWQAVHRRSFFARASSLIIVESSCGFEAAT